MSERYISVNGELMLANSLSISASDLAIQRGYGIFDFLVTVNGKPIFLEDHLLRFYSSAQSMHLPVTLNQKELIGAIDQLMGKNQLPNSGIRLTLTGGNSPDGYSIGNPNLIISQSPFNYQNQVFENGLKLITYEHQRQLPFIKTIDYLKAIYLQPIIKAAGADDVLYFFNGLVSECPRANFFMVTEQNEVLTPKENILHGVTRKHLLKLKGYIIREANINIEMLASAKEAFISSSTKNILPVTSIGGKQIGDGKPGPITRNLYEQFKQLKGISF
ncbi:aminotransferase class IV [Sediminibacterium sp.]|uniref:aminotransferase class IV n=1 Tax=Sediminibacterium sp. TaxID=1917865 RepID=UPI0025D071C1|nr:aminotransferase class IV [Sediminibacterium sp.]MBT9482977.1 aminotransferase class IV family protein [Sediminibacterium sp.]